MKLLIAILLFLATLGIAQDTASDPTTITIAIARTGERLGSPMTGTYHYGEVFQIRGRWILPDAYYIDFACNCYREIGVGGGATLYDGKRAMIAHEVYYDQAFGSASGSAKYFVPWTIAQYHISKKWESEVVYFPYIPLNRSARIQEVLERAKVERKVNDRWRVGGGYAGYSFGNEKWSSQPFATATINTPAGSAELWLQRLPGGGQVQIRYQFVRVTPRHR